MAQLSCFIRSTAHHGGVPAPRHTDGFAPQLRIIPLLHGRIKRVHIDMNDLASGHLANHLIPEFRAVRGFAYLPGLCFPKERNATENANTLGFATQNPGVIYRADEVPLSVKAAGGRGMDLGNFMWRTT